MADTDVAASPARALARAGLQVHETPAPDAQAAPAGQSTEIILAALSHPELGDIGIDEALFAVGRTETPFDSYPADATADLSRRHARIFCESGVVHIADMGSKNGTAVNGVDVRQKTARLADGDEVRFGRHLSYRVRLRARPPAPADTLVRLLLAPIEAEAGLQPIVVTQFPFLVNKTDATFAQYAATHAQQVNYLSRRHAHLFLRRSVPFVEDLGSTNGTFLNGKRLDEHAIRLADGDTLGFGGTHFVYRVQLQHAATASDATLTHYTTVLAPERDGGPAGAGEAGSAGSAGGAGSTGGAGSAGGARVAGAAGVATSDAAPADRGVGSDRTTFVGAPDSFLDIFCVDHIQTADPELPRPGGPAGCSDPAGASGAAGAKADSARVRSQARLLMRQVVAMLSREDRSLLRRSAWIGAGIVLLTALAGLGMWQAGAPERAVRSLVEAGRYPDAARLAGQSLAGHPELDELRALATESWLKGFLPAWLAALDATDLPRLAAALDTLRREAGTNPDASPILQALDWITTLARVVKATAGEAPIRIYADEERIAALVTQWERDGAGYQRAASAIVAHVPAFRDAYAGALSSLRRLQSDNAVTLAALDRLKAALASELAHDRADAIEPLLKLYAEKYPRLAGLGPVHADLHRYRDVEHALRAARLGPLVAQREQMSRQRFATPGFQAKADALVASARLPPAEVVQRYQAIRAAWRAGRTDEALAVLQAIGVGPWADAAARERAHKQALSARFAALTRAANSKAAPADAMTTFYETLEPDDDGFFIQAIERSDGFDLRGVARRAQEHATQASVFWQRYRQGGMIDENLRQEETISDAFRTQTDLLARARRQAEQALHDHALLRTSAPAALLQSADQLAGEAASQRNALRALSSSLPAEIFMKKLAMIDPLPTEATNEK